MSTKQIKVYADVPKELIELINRIKYENFSIQEGRSKLSALKQFVDNSKILPLRNSAKSYPMKTVVVKSIVPDEAVELLNQYEYSKVSTFMMVTAKAVASNYLKKQNLI